MERKVKYNYEFKLRCVREVLKNHRSVESVATENGFRKSNLKRWIDFYQEYGNPGLLPRKYQTYNIDFKLKVLESIEKKCLSLGEACVIFNIPSDSIIINWQRKFSKEGLTGLQSKPKGRPKSMNFKRKKKKSDKPLTREEELLLQNEALRAELDLLKKLQALTLAKKKHKP